MFKLICRKCGKIIKGITLIYSKSNQWECSDCNKKKILCCEQGNKVIFSNITNEYIVSSELAKRYLIPNKIYTVKSLEVGRSSSRITLEEFPNISFNTVLFERYE